MPACDFTLSHSHDPEYLYAFVVDAVRQSGGEVRGDAREGDISIPSPAGRIEGTYVASGRRLQVQITDKPFVVPCATIQGQLAALLADIPPQTVDSPMPAEPLPEPAAPSAPGSRPRGTVYYESDFEPLVVTGRRPGRPWWHWGLAAAAVAGGVWAWRSLRA